MESLLIKDADGFSPLIRLKQVKEKDDMKQEEEENEKMMMMRNRWSWNQKI